MNRTFQAIALLCLLVGLLAGCGGSSTETTTTSSGSSNTATTPEQVHTAWVEAMKANNRDALLSLAADTEYKTAFVDDNLKSLQDRVRSHKDGSLQAVEIRAPTDDGAGRIGVSVWKFAKHTSCYRTELAARGDVWRVTSWGVMYQCPTDVK
jgi:maltose-binding protein MalE